ncbi:MAG: dinitrogenase iron-molybdenum cofactor biosynthesis protein [Porphyromonadaceae bacterium CG2_30_38_12]|nr:MAG: dinitrogenase iron-molybdenum cofactor biosynthesis protein [Porphyromonadaceae bacterium CG2_30_38_12]
MKIAVPTKEGNQIDNHFGHCEFYSIFTVEKNLVVNKQTLESPQGCGCKSNIAYDLAKMDVSIMLAGGIGDGAINKLSSQGIEVIRNCKGDVNELVDEFLKGTLKDGGASCSAHAEKGHDEGHVCNH